MHKKSGCRPKTAAFFEFEVESLMFDVDGL